MNKQDILNDGTERSIVLNGARKWKYMGDGTHCTEIFPTPYFLIVGQKITIENKYNVKIINKFSICIQIKRMI